MAEQAIVCLVREAFCAALLIAAPALLLSLVTGVVFSMVRAGTSIREFTLSFVPRVLAVAAVAVLALPWITRAVVALTAPLVTQTPGAVIP